MKIDRVAIKQALTAEGYTLQRVARDLQVTPTLVSSVIAGRSRSRRVEDHIARILSRDPEEIWDYRMGEAKM